MRSRLAASHLLTENGHAVFIDVGATHANSILLSALQQQGIAKENVDYVIVTHIHLDHAGGAGELIKALPNAKLVVHPKAIRHMINPSKLIEGVTAVYGPEKMQSLFGAITPVPAERIIKAPDNFELSLQGRPLLFLDTPGHARHHFCIFDDKSCSFFSGDTFGISYREFDTKRGAFIIPATTPVQFEPEAMQASIKRLLSYAPDKCYLTHFGEVTQLEKLASDLFEQIDSYVNLAKATLDLDINERQTWLAEQLIQYMLQRLQAHHCQLTTLQCRDILTLDSELNAQGLLVWMDKYTKKQRVQSGTD